MRTDWGMAERRRVSAQFNFLAQDGFMDVTLAVAVPAISDDSPLSARFRPALR